MIHDKQTGRYYGHVKAGSREAESPDHDPFLKVTVNGEDVTHRATEADTDEGYVLCFQQTDGHNDSKLPQIRITGKVVLQGQPLQIPSLQV